MKKIRQWYYRYIHKWIPDYCVLVLISCFILNTCIYYGTGVLTGSWHHYDFTTSFDRMIPSVNWFIYIYFGCFLFWIINYILAAREGVQACFRFAAADMFSRVICGIIFILIPTTNVRPEIAGTGVDAWLMRYLYRTDAAVNLFPSIHCLVSWFCFIGIRSSKKIPFWYKAFSCIFAILVFISTQVTKQHYIVDVVSAVILAEGAYKLMGRIQFPKDLERVYTRINRKVFGERI